MIVGTYDTYCNFGVCDTGYDYVDEETQNAVLLSAGYPEEALELYVVHKVPCCTTQAQARAHVEYYVNPQMLPDVSRCEAPPIEYNGALYSVTAPMGYGGYYFDQAPVMVDDVTCMVELYEDYSESTPIAYFRWTGDRWILQEISYPGGY
jgi:hypothetical protein